MAPDAEKKIAHRVREAELKEVPWNHDAVWRRIAEESVSGNSGHRFLYYAAAVVVIIVVSYAFFVGTRPQKQVVVMETPATVSPVPRLDTPPKESQPATAPASPKSNTTVTATQRVHLKDEEE